MHVRVINLRFSLSLLVSFLLAVSTVQAQDADQANAGDNWPQWRGPHRDAKAVSQDIQTDWENHPPQHLWTNQGVGDGYGGLSIADGLIFSIGNRDGKQVVTASRLGDGETLWTTPVTQRLPEHDYAGSRSTPTYDAGRLFVVSSDGAISCLNAKDGQLIWQRPFSDWGGRMMSVWGFAESPFVDGDAVLCTPGGPDAAIVKLKKSNGEEIWRSSIPKGGDGKNIEDKELKQGAAYSSIVKQKVGRIEQYVQLVAEGVVGVRASDGKLMWGYEDVSNNVAAIPTPVIGDGFVFASSGYGTGACRLDLKPKGREISAELKYFLPSRDFENHHGGMVLHQGYIYAGHGHNKGFPCCVRVSDGQVMWTERGPGSGSAAVVFVDDHLIFRYQNGTIALVEASPKNYRLKGQFTPVVQERESWSHPVVVGGKLYLREQNSIMCYDLAK